MGAGGLGDTIPITGRQETDGSFNVNVTGSDDDSVDVDRTYTFSLPEGITTTTIFCVSFVIHLRD